MGPINWKNSKSIILVSEVTDLAGDATGKNFRRLSDLCKTEKSYGNKMHPHTKFEIPTSNNIRDMLRTQLL